MNPFARETKCSECGTVIPTAAPGAGRPRFTCTQACTRVRNNRLKREQRAWDRDAKERDAMNEAYLKDNAEFFGLKVAP